MAEVSQVHKTTGIKRGSSLPANALYRTMYADVLKKVARFIEAMYGLTTAPPTPNLHLPAPLPGVSPARHFAAYLALSQVSASIWNIPNPENPGSVLLTRPARGGTNVKGFRAIKCAEWMKNVPELVSDYAAALRSKSSWCAANEIEPISWLSQLAAEEAGDNYKNAFETAGRIAAMELIQASPRDEPLDEQEMKKFDLFGIYSSNA